MKKRNHHYVWEHYLKPWTKDGQIACYRKDEHFFKANPKNIAVIRDFYKLNDISSNEIESIMHFINPGSPEFLRDYHLETLTKFTDIFKAKKILKEKGNLTSENEKLIEELIYNTEEELHRQIESDAIRYLNLLYSESTDFFKNDIDFIKFTNFLCIQYFRTYKIYSKISEGTSHKNTWGILRHILPLNITWNMHHYEPAYRLILFKNVSEQHLITSDQPVYNILFKDGQTNLAKELELYYPISPNLAILVTKNLEEFPDEIIEMDTSLVNRFNMHIVQSYYEQLFSDSENTLRNVLAKYRL